MTFWKKKIFDDLKTNLKPPLFLIVKISIYIMSSFFFYIIDQIDIAKIILVLSFFNFFSSILTSFSKSISDLIKRNYKRIKRVLK